MKRILLIDDNLSLRENIAEILTLSEYLVFTAKNGKEGIEMALNVHPDLIFCDIMMPVLDGYGVLKILKKDEGLRHIPFIFISCKISRYDIIKGMSMGADDYITKPFEEYDLLEVIQRQLINRKS